MSKKLTIYCIVSFLLGAVVCGWVVLTLSRGASEIWTTNYVLQMASRFELEARAEYAKGNRTHARDWMNSALLARRHLASGENAAVWPIDMPLSGMVGRILGWVDFTSLSRAVNSKDQLLFFDCAVLALSDPSTELDRIESLFQSIQKQFPHITREKCTSLV